MRGGGEKGEPAATGDGGAPDAPPPGETRIGVVSDTHGLLRDSALEALRGVDRIIHAGDAGQPGILERLEDLAPLTAVRGNVDRGPWASELPRTEVVDAGGAMLYVLHIPEELDLDPGAAGFDVVVHGHTHETREEWIGRVLYLNPGSAGRRRGNHPPTLALLRVGPGDGPEGLEVEFVELGE